MMVELRERDIGQSNEHSVSLEWSLGPQTWGLMYKERPRDQHTAKNGQGRLPGHQA